MRRGAIQKMVDFATLPIRGNLIITQSIPIAEILVHRVTRVHHGLFGKGCDIHVTMEEAVERMGRADFNNTVKKRFATQWV